jgi:hypothetical protein
MEILDKLQGNKFVSLATYPVPQKEPQSLVMLRTVYFFASWIICYKLKGQIKGIKSNFIFASSVAHNEVGKAIYMYFLPKALEAGTFVAAPEQHVVGKRIENIQAAFDYQKKGMSTKKVVVSL